MAVGTSTFWFSVSLSAQCGRNYLFEVINVFCFLKLGSGPFYDSRANPYYPNTLKASSTQESCNSLSQSNHPLTVCGQELFQKNMGLTNSQLSIVLDFNFEFKLYTKCVISVNDIKLLLYVKQQAI